MSGTNILISDDQSALLYDFGMSTLVQDLERASVSLTQTTSFMGASVRWAAPEIFNSPSKISLSSDDTHLDQFRSRCFHGAQANPSSGRSREHWKILEMCWEVDPPSRPITEALESQFADEDLEGLEASG